MLKTFLLLMVLVASAPSLGAGLSSQQRAVLDGLIEGFKEQGAYPAVSVLIDRNGKTLYLNTLGSANLEYNIAVDEDSAYAIGSITKSFTALSALLLVERGKLSLDKPVKDYLPTYAGPGADIAVKHLLGHTSGIPNYTGEIPGVADTLKRTAFTREQMLATFVSQELLFIPGEKFSYSNSGYYVLGLIIEAVSGQDYYDFLEANIFEPLEMQHTYAGNDAEIIPKRVSGYDVDGNGHINASPWSHLVPFSAGSLISTLGDLVRYRRGVFHDPDFASVRELIVEQQKLNDGTINLYAQGALILSAPDGHPKISHSGDIWGFASNHAYYPEEDVTIVVLTNRQAEAPSPVSLEQKLARVVFDIPPPVIGDQTLSDDVLARYVGDYQLHPFIFGPPVYGFIAREGRLFLRFGGRGVEASPMIPLLAQGDGKFVMSFDDEWTFRFDAAPDGSRSFEARARDGVFFGKEM